MGLSWLHFDYSNKIFDCSIRVYRCISELVPINAYSCMKRAQAKAWAAPPAIYGVCVCIMCISASSHTILVMHQCHEFNSDVRSSCIIFTIQQVDALT